MKQTLQLYPHETYLPTDSQLPKSGPIPYPLTNDYMFRAVIQKDPESAKHLVAALLNLEPKKILDFKILNRLFSAITSMKKTVSLISGFFSMTIQRLIWKCRSIIWKTGLPGLSITSPECLQI